MTSINLAVALVCGCGIGLLLLALYPGGLGAAYGLILIALALCAGLCAWAIRREPHQSRAALLLMFFMLGCGLALLQHQPARSDDLAYYNAAIADNSSDSGSASYITIAGVVSGEPVLSDNAQTLRISANTIWLGDSATAITVKGDLLAHVARYPEYSYGERLSLAGNLTDPPKFNGFDYAEYLAHLGIRSYINTPRIFSFGHEDSDGLAGLIIGARTDARSILQKTVAEPQASLAVGVVIGDRSSIPQELTDAFKTTGTTHILAISGQNISLFVGMLWLLAGGGRGKQRMPLWLTLVAIAMLVIYTVFTGATPSVIRAAIMGAILLMAPIVGRRYDPLAALAIAAAGMIVFDPYVMADAGFQLSFLAMWGITVLAPSLYSAISFPRVPAFLAAPIAATLAAQVATLPLNILLSGQFALVAPFATLTAELSLLPLMLSGIITAIIGLFPFIGFLTYISGAAVWLSATWLLWWVQFWASVPFASISVEGFNQAYAVLYYAVLFPAVWLLADRRRKSRFVALWPRVQPFALGFTAVTMWAVAIMLLLLR